jgi:hypothetical protein
VTFSSIPATYRDLVLVIDFVGSSGTVGGNVRFNSDSGSNYPRVTMVGSNDVASSTSGTETSILSTTSDSTARVLATFNIMDYSATDKHKSVLTRANRPTTVLAGAWRWADTAAITTIQVSTAANSYAAGSVFSLYGIAA